MQLAHTAAFFGLYDQNNFYYCRSEWARLGCCLVYTTKTISTIVDRVRPITEEVCLYDQNNFYYCRYDLRGRYELRVYTTKTISTIVDLYSMITLALLSIRPKQFLLL